MKHLNEHIETLIADKLSGQISPEDDALLAELIRTDEAVRTKWEQSVALVSFYRASAWANGLDDDIAWDRLSEKIQPVKAKKIFSYKWYVAAGVLVPLLLAALWFGLFSNHLNSSQKSARTATIKVTLSDGTSYALEGNKEIVTREIRFGAQSAQRINGQKNNRQNELITLTIPRGKTYAIVLDDGTSVKINSASTFKFPLFFEGNTREVQLDGEAYFEVTKSPFGRLRGKIPFIVKTQEMDIKVLGTKFNINTYPGNDAQTSLIEGSVAVNDHTAKELLIKPGQAAIKRGTSAISVETFSPEQILSWLKGTYYFNNMPLREIVNITNRVTGEDLYITDSKIANYRFSGALETNKPIKVLLENIKSSSAVVQYSIKGGKIELY